MRADDGKLLRISATEIGACPSVDSPVNKSSFRQDAAVTRVKERPGFPTSTLEACAPQRFSAETAPNAFGAAALRFCANEAAGDWPRQLILFSLDFMGSAVAFRLGGTSIISRVESHLYLLNDLGLAVDEVVHHDDVMLAIVIRPRGNVAGLDPDRRDAGVIKLDAEEGQASIARRGRNETTE